MGEVLIEDDARSASPTVDEHEGARDPVGIRGQAGAHPPQNAVTGVNTPRPHAIAEVAAFLAGINLNLIGLSLKQAWFFHLAPYREQAVQAGRRLELFAGQFLPEGRHRPLTDYLTTLRAFHMEIFSAHEGEFHWSFADLLRETILLREDGRLEPTHYDDFCTEVSRGWQLVAQRIGRVREFLSQTGDPRTRLLVRLGELVDQGLRAEENFRHLYAIAGNQRAASRCMDGERVEAWSRGRPIFEDDKRPRAGFDPIDRWPIYQPPDESWLKELASAWEMLDLPGGVPPEAMSLTAATTFEAALPLVAELTETIKEALKGRARGGRSLPPVSEPTVDVGITPQISEREASRAMPPDGTEEHEPPVRGPFGLSYDGAGLLLRREGHQVVADLSGSKQRRGIIRVLLRAGEGHYTPKERLYKIWEDDHCDAPQLDSFYTAMTRVRSALKLLNVGVKNNRELGYSLEDLFAAETRPTGDGPGRTRRRNSRRACRGGKH